MAEFGKYAPLLKRLEKWTYTNLPSDLGGPTFCGVTLKTFRAEFGQDKGIDDLKAMTPEQWERIMRKYWNLGKCNYIQDQWIAELFADWIINSGPKVIKKLQSIVGVDTDGIVGPKTLAAINGANPRCLHCKLLQARYDYYDRIIVANPAQEVNRKGWYNRLKNFDRYAR